MSERRGYGTVRGKTASYNLSPAAHAAIEALMASGAYPSKSAAVERAVLMLWAIQQSGQPVVEREAAAA